MRAVDIIRRKRDGEQLGRREIAHFISAYTSGDIPDYQVSAFLMAVTLNGMSEEETLALTEEMLRSGSVLDLSGLGGARVDKHSTGGVGDKTSLVIAPLAAATGLFVPMISGRGLGHSGGTLDKLESIPGLDVHLDLNRFRRTVEEVGCSIIGQTEEIAPADRKLYALRDVTGTVESIPLITSSILSKKLAEGIDALVLDVKVGSGAFMKEERSALELANLLVRIPRRMGKRAVALLTDMDQPLGACVGNALEVRESIEVLQDEGPEDLRQLCLLLTAHMLIVAEAASELVEGKKMAEDRIASGAGLEKLIKMVESQGGDPRAVEDPSRLPAAKHSKEVPARRAGFVSTIDTEALGLAAMLLGAGRERLDDRVDHAAGLVVHRKTGDPVSQADPLVTLQTNDPSRLPEAERLVAGAYVVREEPPPPQPLVRAVIGTEDLGS